MKKRCMEAGCYQIAEPDQVRCAKHIPKQKARQTEQRSVTGRRNSNVYDSRRWRRLSQKKRVIDPLCEQCLEQGIHTYADVVDHIIEIEDSGEKYNLKNLRSLCHSCHNNKTKSVAKKRTDDDKHTRDSDGLVYG